MKVTNKHHTLVHKVANAFGLQGYEDRALISTKECEDAKELLLKLKPLLLESFPKQYTLKLRESDRWNTNETITILRQLLKPLERTILCQKKHFYCKKRGRSRSTPIYKIL